MGIIISRFRVSHYLQYLSHYQTFLSLQKKKTTLDILEALENDIKEIENYGRNTEQAHKKTVGRFILVSVLVYLLTASLFYFFFFPATIYDQLFYIIPLLLAPIM